jgi:integrase
MMCASRRRYRTCRKSSRIWSVCNGCEVAFGMPEDLTKEQRRAWRIQHVWAPNQLRHTAATQIRRQFGLEAAQITLGHTRADVTQIYAERDERKAADIMLQVG